MREKDIASDLQFLTAFEGLARALQEVSIMKMQNVRNKVLSSRNFHQGLTQAYYEVRLSSKYDAVKAKLAVEPRKENVCVLLSANSTMYGSLTDQVYAKFREYVKDHTNEDLILIGKLGKDKFEKETFKREYKYYDLEEEKKMYTFVLKIINDLIFYESITVFYGKFINIFTQEVEIKNFPGNMLHELLTNVDKQVTPDMLFLLEPSSEELEVFFARQIMGFLFRSSVFEFELARHAARISTLEKSLDNTEQQRKRAILLFNKFKREKGGSNTARTIALFGKNKRKR